MHQEIPSSSPKPKPPHCEPHRQLAIEAMIFVSIYINQPMRARWFDLMNRVVAELPWAPRVEIYSALQRMVKSGRVVEHFVEERTLPLYDLPEPYVRLPRFAERH